MGTGAVVNVDGITEKLIAANRHPRMQQLYERYFHHWFEMGGGVFANFSFIGNPSKWGSWGVLEYQDQPINEAPKYLALRNLIN